MCHAVPGKWCVFGCMLSAGGSFQWFRNTLGDRGTAAQRSEGDPTSCSSAEAATAPAGCEGLLFLPYLTGERCPHPDPLARGGWVGLTARTTRAMMIRSVLEGVTFGMRDALQIIRGMGIAAARSAPAAAGPAATSGGTCRPTSTDAPVVMTNAAEGPAYGAALLAGVGTGAWSTVGQACESSIRAVTTVRPDPASAAAYGRRSAVYDKLYGDLKDRFGEMARL